MAKSYLSLWRVGGPAWGEHPVKPVLITKKKALSEFDAVSAGPLPIVCKKQ